MDAKKEKIRQKVMECVVNSERAEKENEAIKTTGRTTSKNKQRAKRNLEKG